MRLYPYQFIRRMGDWDAILYSRYYRLTLKDTPLCVGTR